MIPLAPHLTAFLSHHLPSQRGASSHTCDTYAYSFQLLVIFASERLRVPPSSLTLEHLDAPLVMAFLEYLEEVRHNSPDTRNVRLAAVRSFFRFVEYRHPAVLDQIRSILAIPFKQSSQRLVPYLVNEAVQALLDAPNPHTRTGIRDQVMLHLTIAAGLRVSELIGLRLDDVILQPPSILIRGKGRKERVLPLWKETTTALRAWLVVRGEVAIPELFVNARGQAMSRWGFAHVLQKHVAIASQNCPSLQTKRVSPHVLRHTCAMITLQATHDIRKVALWLGHSRTETTERYTRADPTEKMEALSAIMPPNLRRGEFQPSDKLIALLKSESLCGSKKALGPVDKEVKGVKSP